MFFAKIFGEPEVIREQHTPLSPDLILWDVLLFLNLIIVFKDCESRRYLKK